MDIGSAKIDTATCERVPHHLLDVVDVTQPFSALEYYKLALPAIQVRNADTVTKDLLGGSKVICGVEGGRGLSLPWLSVSTFVPQFCIIMCIF